jgi:hypothetical protein
MHSAVGNWSEKYVSTERAASSTGAEYIHVSS